MALRLPRSRQIAPLSSIATGAHPDVHRIPHLVWYDRERSRVVEYGSSFAAVRAAGMARSLLDTIINLNRLHLGADAVTVYEALEDAVQLADHAICLVLGDGNTGKAGDALKSYEIAIQGGAIRIVDHLPCPSGELPLRWNQEGRPGVAGPGVSGVGQAISPVYEGFDVNPTVTAPANQNATASENAAAAGRALAALRFLAAVGSPKVLPMLRAWAFPPTAVTAAGSGYSRWQGRDVTRRDQQRRFAARS